jgi:Tol biopolymer transport system component
LSVAATQQGVILGTAAYMSPEQARGKAVDKRSDIWAFGAVLFEMLTGQAAFQGEDVTEILASVVKADVNLDLLPPKIHPRISEALIRCLQKEQKKRYADIGEAEYEIERVLADPGGVFIQPISAVKPRRKARIGLPWAAAVFILGSIIAAIAVWNLKPVEPHRLTRFDYDLPEGQQFGRTVYSALAVSPDGRQFVYSTGNGLYLRSLDEWTAKLIPGTEGETAQPFFSPDGKWIGYLSGGDRKLKKIGINGGAPVALCDFKTFMGAYWGADNTIIYGTRESGIMRVSANGGTPQSLIKPKSGLATLPQILPDGKSILFTGVDGGTRLTIMVQSLKSGEPKPLFAGVGARYLPTGQILYAVENNLFAVPFDPDRLETTGGQVPVVEGIDMTFAQPYALSDSGTLIYIPGTTSSSKSNLVWVDREGKEEPLGAGPDFYNFVKISPDGTKVALGITSGKSEDIYIWDTDRKNMTKLTFDEADDSFPLWTPDGKRIVFRSLRDKFGIYTKAANGTGEDEFLAPSGNPMSWSKDGKTMVVGFLGGGTDNDIGMLSLEGDKTIKPLLREKGNQAVPMVSPDGRCLAYMSDESGRYEVYVRPFPNVNSDKWKVSTDGGRMPKWSRDGRELFYWTDDVLMAVSVETEPEFKPGAPKVLLKRKPIVSYSMGSPGISWDVDLDAKRFLMIKPAVDGNESAEGPPRKINIVLNWTEELKRLVPAGK